MNGLTRYMMLSGGNRAPDTNGNRMEYGGGMQNQMRGGYENNYRTENARRTETRGREGGARSEYRGGYENANRNGYESNTGAMRNEYRGNDPMESRFRDDRGREHYDNGRYAPMRSEYRGGENMRSDDEYARMGGEQMDDAEGNRRSWEIIENRKDSPMDSYEDWYSAEKEHKPNIIGFSSASKPKNAASPMNQEMADEWMASIKNEDGTKGAHWSMSEVKRLMQQKGIEGDPVKVWVAMNAEYSDRQKVNKKYGVDRPDFYLDSALAYWLNDVDAVKDKLSAYYTYIVKH